MKHSFRHIVTALALAVAGSFLKAADHTVSSNLDDGSPGTLRELIDLAASGDRIFIPQGMVIVLAEELVAGTKSLVLEGLGNGATISGAGTDRLINFSGTAGQLLECYNLTFTNGNKSDAHGGAIYVKGNDGLILSNCTFSGNSAPDHEGGAIYASDSSVTVAAYDCMFSNNSSKYGGAITTSSSSLTLNLERCVFDSNSSTDRGGALYGSSAQSAKDCVFTNNVSKHGGVMFGGTGGKFFEDCLFVENGIFNGDGGGVAYSRDDMSYKNCTFKSNYCNGGSGGVFHRYNGKLDVVDCIFEDNWSIPSANWHYGGAIWTRGSPTTVISNSVFRGNKSFNNGPSEWGDAGAIGTYSDGELEVYNTTFEGNYSQRGLGIIRLNTKGLFQNCTFIDNTSGKSDGSVFYIGTKGEDKPVRFVNSTFYNNRTGVDVESGNRRGAIVISSEDSYVDIDHCTIVGNLSSEAAIYAGSTSASNTRLRNSIIADNLMYNNQVNDIRGAYLAIENCILTEPSNGHNTIEEGSYSDNLFSVVMADLQLGELADNDSLVEYLDGSFLQTMALGLRSIARKKGLLLADITTDARGYPRPASPAELPDIGAYEFQSYYGTLILVQ